MHCLCAFWRRSSKINCQSEFSSTEIRSCCFFSISLEEERKPKMNLDSSEFEVLVEETKKPEWSPTEKSKHHWNKSDMEPHLNWSKTLSGTPREQRRKCKESSWGKDKNKRTWLGHSGCCPNSRSGPCLGPVNHSGECWQAGYGTEALCWSVHVPQRWIHLRAPGSSKMVQLQRDELSSQWI